MAQAPRADRSAERSLLVAAARAFLNEEPPAEALTAVNVRSLDWDRILRRAVTERLAPVLYAVFRALPTPVPILDRLRTSWVSARRQYLLGVEQLSGVLSALEREGVAAIPLKGPTLGEALYPDPGLRPFTDLDLLIHKADLSRVLQLLPALGYRHLDDGRSLEYAQAYGNAACFVGEGTPPADFPLDVHWKLLDYRSGRRAAAIDLQEIWDRAVKVQGWSQPVLGLCPEDLLVYLALHWAVHHALSGLAWPLDLALLLRRQGAHLDWDGVAERAQRWRVAGALYFALCEIHDQFGVGVPPALLARLRPAGLRRSALDWLRHRRSERLERLDYLVPLLLIDRGSDLLWLLAVGALPPPGWARARYGKESLFAAYRAHYERIGKVCLRTIRATLAR